MLGKVLDYIKNLLRMTLQIYLMIQVD